MNALLTLNPFLPIASSSPRHARRKKLRPSSFGRKLNIESLEGRAVPASLAVDFATLDNFAVLGLNGSKMDITNPQTHIGGNVGLASDSNQNFSDGQISGSLVVDRGVSSPSYTSSTSNITTSSGSYSTSDYSTSSGATYTATSANSHGNSGARSSSSPTDNSRANSSLIQPPAIARGIT